MRGRFRCTLDCAHRQPANPLQPWSKPAKKAQTRASGKGAESSSDEQQAPSFFWQQFRLAQTDQTGAASNISVEKAGQQASPKTPVQLEEVVVTAQKRAERLVDVPQSVTVLPAADLVMGSGLIVLNSVIEKQAA